MSGIPAISVVNAVGSLIARTTKLGVYLNAGRESSVASTKAFTTQVLQSHYHPLPRHSRQTVLTCLMVSVLVAAGDGAGPADRLVPTAA